MSEDWRLAAACRDESPELFFPIGSGWRAQKQIAEAKAVCADCPVRAECLAWAFETRDDHAVLGGKTGPERREMRRAQKAAALAASS